MSGMVLRQVEVQGSLADVRLAGPVVAEVAPAVEACPGDVVLDGAGGALIPGLHDHHLHLLAAAAAANSVQLGPPSVRDRAQWEATLRAAGAATAPGQWVRGVGYHESVAGPITRHDLDAVVPDRPVRVQHASGALWVLNGPGLAAVGLHSDTGRLLGADEWLRTATGDAAPPDVAPVGARLASYGVTGVTDATPSDDLGPIALLAAATGRGELPQSVVVTGSPALAAAAPLDGVRWGPVKVVVADYDLPTVAGLAASVETAHRAGRAVAVHCVTAVALALTLAALDDAGVRDGDRIEHGSVVTPDAAQRMAEMGLTVVTQPGFVATRGDRYLAEVDRRDLPHLYRCATLLEQGVAVGGSTDAPFGDLDPWRAVRAAIDRRTEAGRVLGPCERLAPPRALDLFLTSPESPGGAPRRVAPGAPADLCLLDGPLDEVLSSPSADRVVATVIAGGLAYHR